MADTQPKLIKVSNLREIALKPEMILGRTAECDLQLTEGHASRRHARLFSAEGGVWVEDLNSANGTFVNGARITGKVKLSAGDRLRFDVEEFDFLVPGAAAPVDEGKTQFRDPASAVVDAESSGVYKRPGAWADPDAIGADGASKTKFIDPAQLKQMMNNAPQAAVAATVDGPHLQVVSGNRAGLNIKLTVGESGVKDWTVGSQAGREVQFQDSGVSALHAKIVNEGERWKVLDQMSANGTFVNGKRSNVSYLTAGDRVRFGPVECIFWTSRGAPAARRSAASSSSGARAESKSNTALIAGIAFAVTIVVLFLVYKFVL
ncbi:MAG TPA: FHA domain-containing protein [Steroidobacteraceae bacterium]|nr:FHA domain-containing protein [Steroidobacteraceae bacterium]